MKTILMTTILVISSFAQANITGKEYDRKLKNYVTKSLPYVNTLLSGIKKGECTDEKCWIYDGGVLKKTLKCSGVLNDEEQVVGICTALADYEDASTYQVSIKVDSRKDYANIIDVDMTLVHKD